MSTQHSTTAEKRAAQLNRLLAEKDARMQLDRERPLPPWLASRRNRRIMAVFPVLPLAVGFYAGMLPDTMLRSALMMSGALLAMAGVMTLHRSTRLLNAVPDRLLDEREIGERNVAYRRSHNLVLALMGLLLAMAIADSTMRKIADAALVEGDGWIWITFTAMTVASMVPAAVQAWRYSEPLDDTDD